MRKFTSLFLVITLLALSGDLVAKGRQGKVIIISKNDGDIVRGELIAVKEHVLFLNPFFYGDESIDIKDIKKIIVIIKSKALIGFGVGVAGGAFLGYVSPGTTYLGFSLSSSDGAKTGAITGGLVGLVVGLIMGIDRNLQIEGKSEEEVREILEYLNSKARVPDYK